MDFIALGFYAVVCGLLSVFAPQLGTPIKRMGVGAAIGIGAALVLPYVRDLIGG